MSEAVRAFTCFGAACVVRVSGDGGLGSAAVAAASAEARLLDGDRRFSRLEPASELSRLNADVRNAVPVSAAMARFVAAAVEVARLSDGAVDATLPPADAGFPPPHRVPRWRELDVDVWNRVVRRPPGLALDGDGVAPGLLADQVAAELSTHAAFALDCGGDLRLGGTARTVRSVRVAGGRRVLDAFELRDGALATRRLDVPGVGLAQATALAPSALEAAWRARAALLAAPADAERWLPHGGLLVGDDDVPRKLPASRRIMSA